MLQMSTYDYDLMFNRRKTEEFFRPRAVLRAAVGFPRRRPGAVSLARYRELKRRTTNTVNRFRPRHRDFIRAGLIHDER